jgi:hypothetical protein
MRPGFHLARDIGIPQAPEFAPGPPVVEDQITATARDTKHVSRHRKFLVIDQPKYKAACLVSSNNPVLLLDRNFDNYSIKNPPIPLNLAVFGDLRHNICRFPPVVEAAIQPRCKLPKPATSRDRLR